MTDRREALESLAADLRERDDVADAFVAKSFTDHLLVLDVHGEAVPADVRDRLAERDLRGVGEVYGDGEAEDGAAGGAGAPSAPASTAGAVGDATRHQFVDCRTRGEHQSYVVD
ncbi:MAG: hypothetical protein ABEJ42_02605 [Halobacteriaceae archaeon]